MEYALLSVSNKDNIEFLASELIKLGFKILSTSGTLKTLRDSNIEAIDVADYTGYKSMFDGRVKTIHPMLHGAVLYRRSKEADKLEAEGNGILNISVVCINLYPFKETTERTDDLEEIMENIDIGGPCIIRAAAKNYKDVVVITDIKDYGMVIDAIKNNKNTAQFRRSLMIKAFEHSAAYECEIANYMNRKFNNGFGDKKFISGSKVMDMEYGENPHQKGALYSDSDFYTKEFRSLKGNVSFNNMMDINISVKIVSSFKNEKSVCIVKHGNPCGFSIKNTLLEAYAEALKCDTKSAYGGVVAINGQIDVTLATEIVKTYVEVVLANKIDPEAMQIFNSKKRMKAFECGDGSLNMPTDMMDFKRISGGFLYQETDMVLDGEIEQATLVSKVKATASQLKDLKVAYKLAAFTKSNCITYVRDLSLVAIGMGSTSRVDAGVNAARKAKEMNLTLSGSVMASEAFLPFADSIELAARHGVKAIIQPGGSIRDKEVIESADANGIALYFTGRRHFLH